MRISLCQFYNSILVSVWSVLNICVGIFLLMIKIQYFSSFYSYGQYNMILTAIPHFQSHFTENSNCCRLCIFLAGSTSVFCVSSWLKNNEAILKDAFGNIFSSLFTFILVSAGCCLSLNAAVSVFTSDMSVVHIPQHRNGKIMSSEFCFLQSFIFFFCLLPKCELYK